MANNTKPFWCYIWHQQIFPYVCMHRYKKGMKKCQGCNTGKRLVQAELARVRAQSATEKEHGISHDGD